MDRLVRMILRVGAHPGDLDVAFVAGPQSAPRRVFNSLMTFLSDDSRSGSCSEFLTRVVRTQSGIDDVCGLEFTAKAETSFSSAETGKKGKPD